MQDRCTVRAKHNIGSEIDLDAPDGDSACVSARPVHSLCQVYHRLRNHFRHTRLYSQVTRLKWKLVSVRFELVLVLVQDRCTVCAKYIIGSKIILDAPDGTP
jgi:hypothetical protein